MREDDIASWELALATADDEIAGGTRGFVRVVDDGLGQLGAGPDGGGGVARVDEDDCVALVEFGPDGRKVFVAEIFAVVGGEEGDAVGLEVVEGILQGFDRAVDVCEAGQRTEEAEFGRLMGADGCGVIVPFVSESAAGSGVAFGGGACDFGAGSGEGEDRG